MSRITKLRVGKGKTTGNEKQTQWIKHYFEIEIELGDPPDVEVAKANALGLIDGWLSKTPAPLEAKAELELSKDQLEKLPFKPYKEGSSAGWIFADIQGAEKLYALIKESQSGKVPLHGFEYSISKGETREFIGRKPIS